MERLADRFPAAVGARKRALDQAARELLLAQSSDWAFIVTSATAVPYAVRRVREHLARFERLASAVDADTVNGEGIDELVAAERASGCEPIYPWLDYRVFAAPAE